MKEINAIMKIIIPLRCRGFNEAADLIIKQYTEIQNLKKESK